MRAYSFEVSNERVGESEKEKEATYIKAFKEVES